MVTFIAPSYNESISNRPLIDSLLNQTNPNWQCIVYHNGPNPEFKKWVESYGDTRIVYMESSTNTEAWGCYNREDAINHVTAHYIVQTSIQDIYDPNIVQLIVDITIDEYPGIIIWDSINHLTGPDTLICNLAPGQIDWGNAAVDTTKAREVGINYPTEFMADWLFFKQLLDSTPDITVKKINQVLTYHN